MKRAKMRALVADVLTARESISDRPITVDQLVIDFDARTVTVRGRKVVVQTTGITIPILDTERFIMPREGTVL